METDEPLWQGRQLVRKENSNNDSNNDSNSKGNCKLHSRAESAERTPRNATATEYRGSERIQFTISTDATKTSIWWCVESVEIVAVVQLLSPIRIFWCSSLRARTQFVLAAAVRCIRAGSVRICSYLGQGSSSAPIRSANPQSATSRCARFAVDATISRPPQLPRQQESSRRSGTP